MAGAVPGLENAPCCGAAVVTIGNVEAGQGGEGVPDQAQIRSICEHPGGVADTVPGDKINFRCCGRSGADQGIHGLLRFVNQEDGTGLGIQGFDVANPVILLVGAGELVLPDDAV